MTTAKGPNGADAYTRESVEAYLRAVEAERAKIEAAIAVARGRTERATAERERLERLAGDPTPAGADGAQATNGGSPEPEATGATGATGAMDTEPRGIPAALVDALDDETLWLPSATAGTVARD
jgi:hypothetical protein